MSGLDEAAARVSDCCADPDNLEEQPRERGDLTVRVCRECGRRHFEVAVDPAVIGVEVSS